MKFYAAYLQKYGDYGVIMSEILWRTGQDYIKLKPGIMKAEVPV